MNANDLLDLIGEAKDEYVHDAKADQKVKKTRFPRWTKWSSAIAACLVLVIGIGSFLLPRMGGNAPAENGSGSGHEEGSTFMSYAGPIFPLTLLEENESISAQRTVTMDFAPWVPVWITNEEEAAARTDLTETERQVVLENYNEWFPEGGRYQSSDDIQVSDSYLLTNDDSQDQMIRILYPFVSSLNSLGENRPTLSADGVTLETELHAGSYAGEFQGAWENWEETGENPGSLNLQNIESWEGYRDLLSDGSYLQRALGEYTDLSHILVTVYEFTDAWGPEADEDAGVPNPSIRVMFDIDYENTTVLSYGFHAGYYDNENGIMGKGFSIREADERGYGTPYYLIVIGEDVRNLNCQGFATGGWDTEKTVEAGVTITRTEADLESALRIAAGYNYQELVGAGSYSVSDLEYDFEMYYGLMKEHLVTYGVLSEHGAERYDSGWIEELDVVGVDRVWWLEAEITIPAGKSVTLDAALKKEPSYDFYCAGTENKGISGYDLVTTLGSNLDFTQQTACLEDRGQIEIVRQNFGFDPANSRNEVELDLNTPHYYLEVRKIESTE